MAAVAPTAILAPSAAFVVGSAPRQLRNAPLAERLEALDARPAVHPQAAVPVPTVAAGVAVGAVLAGVARRRGRAGRKGAARHSQPVSLDEKRFPILTERAPIGSFPNLPETVHPGVVTGQGLRDLLDYAKEKKFAIPAVNCVSSSSINACLEAARKADAPIMIQFSSGGSQFYAGKGLDNTEFHACIAGAVSGAYHVRAMAEQYGVPVILHTDHCSKALLPWLDGLLEANERYFEKYNEPLFSSHMIDLSEEPLEENLEICSKYNERMAKVNLGLEIELGITGGEEDGVNNEDVAQEDLYSKPEEIMQAYEVMTKTENSIVTIAAAFGNVHGVYSPGNVKLDPEILGNAQKYISEKLGGSAEDKPVRFVFHGGSGSDLKDIRQALEYGVVKMNIDTDTQWAYWKGIREFEAKYRPYLQAQIGNPEGETKPNKKYYDPRACLREAEKTTVERLQQCFEDLRCTNILGLGPPEVPTNVLGPRRGGLPA